MTTKWIEKFIDNLRGILEKPPYLVFVFIGAVFVIVSIMSGRYFDRFWIFFLYSIIGTIWRYIEKDIDSGIQKLFKDKDEKYKNISHLVIIIVYHIGNIALFWTLLYYLNLI